MATLDIETFDMESLVNLIYRDMDELMNHEIKTYKPLLTGNHDFYNPYYVGFRKEEDALMCYLAFC